MLRHEYRKNTQDRGESKVTGGHQPRAGGIISYYLGTILKEVNWTNIYEAPTGFKELPSCCRGHKDESDLAPALQGLTLMEEPWRHFSCTQCTNETSIKDLYSVLITTICI